MAAQHRTTAETETRQLIDRFQRAIRAKDLNEVLSVYASDIVSFDLVPPMQHVGIAAYRRPWEETFASFEGQIGYPDERNRHERGGDQHVGAGPRAPQS